MISTKDCALVKNNIVVIFEYDTCNVEIHTEDFSSAIEPAQVMSVQDARVEYRRLQSLGFVPTKDY